MTLRPALAVTVSVLAACSCSTPPELAPDAPQKEASTALTGVPDMGARVRIIAPELGRGWRTGMFSQTRVPEACYNVLLFNPGPIRMVDAFVPVQAMARMQLSSIGLGGGLDVQDLGAASLHGEAWREVALDSVQRAGLNCDRIIRTRS
ncbi:MAG: hypothetical protein ACRENP_26020 [Longimicrobiales bacterium]